MRRWTFQLRQHDEYDHLGDDRALYDQGIEAITVQKGTITIEGWYDNGCEFKVKYNLNEAQEKAFLGVFLRHGR